MIKIGSKRIEVSGINILFKELLKHQRTTLTKIVKKRNELYPSETTTTQNISNKLSRETMRAMELFEFAELMGYNICFTTEYGNENQSDEVINSIKKEDNNFISLIDKGCSVIDGINFKHIIIVGEQAVVAAEWLKSRLKEDIKDSDEALLIYLSNNKFGTLAKPSNYIVEN